MIPVLKKLLLGLGLLAATSSVLLLSDVSRRSSGSDEVHRVAILQIASSALMDTGVAGMRTGLSDSGLTEGQSEHARLVVS